MSALKCTDCGGVGGIPFGSSGAMQGCGPCKGTGYADGRVPVRCADCASDNVTEVPIRRGAGWTCKACGTHWGYVEGVSSHDFHYTAEEMRERGGRRGDL
jgi:hypothetical protein